MNLVQIERPKCGLSSKIDIRTLALLVIVGLGFLIRFVGLGSDPIFRDEAYYVSWSHVPSWSYYDHPPAVALLIASSTALLGESELAVRAVFAFAGSSTTLLVYMLGKRHFGANVGTIACTLYAFDFGNILFSRLAFNDAPLVMLFALFLLLYPKDGKFDARTIALLGTTLGAGMLAKYTMAVLPIAVIFYVIIAHFAKPNERARARARIGTHFASLIAVFGCALVCFIPVILWNSSHDWASFSYQGGHALSAEVIPSVANAGFFVDIFYFPRRMAMGFTPISLLILGLGAVLFSFDLHDNRARAFLFAPAALFGLGAAVVGFVPSNADPGILPLPWDVVVSLCYIPEALFIIFFALSVKGFRSDSHRFLVVCACVPMLMFVLSRSRLPHWALPSMVPLCILGAELLVRLPDLLGYENATLQNYDVPKKRLRHIFIDLDSGKTAKVAFAIFVIVLAQCAAYSVASLAMRDRPISFIETPLRSGYSASWYVSEVALREMARDFDEVYLHHEGSIVLAPSWQTYSGLDYYSRYACERPGYTYAYDYQLGVVFAKDVSNSHSKIRNATIASYIFSGGNITLEDVLQALAYSPINTSKLGNRWTAYARCGLDFFVVEKERVSAYPYFIAYSEMRDTPYVIVQFEGIEYRADKAMLNYNGESGKTWAEVFNATAI